MLRRIDAVSAGLVAFAMLLTGCGGKGDRPDLASVRGKVTLDNVALPSARVTFEPPVGRPSHGRTNDAGEYELEYLAGVSGAAIGPHKIVISTNDLIEDAKTGKRQMIPEKVPVIYNRETTLTADVKEGDNEISFDLKSDSSSVQRSGT